MRHPANAALIENKAKDAYNFGSDFSQKLNSAPEKQCLTSAVYSEAALCINEFYKLSQSKHNKCGRGTGTLSRNNAITAGSGSFLRALSEINSSTRIRMGKLLQNREHQNVSSFASLKNNTLTTTNNSRPNADSNSNSSLQTLQNINSGTCHRILNISGISSTIDRFNFRKAVHRNEQVLSQDAHSYQDVFKTMAAINKKKNAEIINVRSNPSSYNTVQTAPSCLQSSNLLSTEASTFTMQGIGRNETAPKSQIEAWNQFESHINMIDDLTSSATQHLIKPFRCSSAFQSVLSDMCGCCNNDKPQSCTKTNSHTVNVAIFATKFLGKVKALNKLKNSRNGTHASIRRAESTNQPSKNSVKNSKRGWGLLRQCVNDFKAHERMHQDTELRDIPVQNLKNLSDFESTRRDLYQRYGIIPTTRNDGTVTRQNMMLSERARHFPERGDQSSTWSRKYNQLNEFASFRQTTRPLK